jgi:hypothetical protein
MEFTDDEKKRKIALRTADVKKTDLEINYIITSFWLKDVHCE